MGFLFISVYRSTIFGLERDMEHSLTPRGLGGVKVVGDRRHCNRDDYGIWFTVPPGRGSRI